MSETVDYLAEWKKTQELGVTGFTGEFFHKLAELMTGGEVPEDPREGDLVVWDDQGNPFGFEIKSSSNASSFRIKWGQLLDHKERWEGFPYDGQGAFLYFLYSYNNREKKRKIGDKRPRRPLIRRAIAKKNGFEFLGEETNQLWILPLEAMQILQQKSEVSKARLPAPRSDKEAAAWKFPRLFLRRVSRDPKAYLGPGWIVRRGNVNTPCEITVGERSGKVSMNFLVVMFQNGAPTPQLEKVVWKD